RENGGRSDEQRLVEALRPVDLDWLVPVGNLDQRLKTDDAGVLLQAPLKIGKAHGGSMDQHHPERLDGLEQVPDSVRIRMGGEPVLVNLAADLDDLAVDLEMGGLALLPLASQPKQGVARRFLVLVAAEKDRGVRIRSESAQIRYRRPAGQHAGAAHDHHGPGRGQKLGTFLRAANGPDEPLRVVENALAIL